VAPRILSRADFAAALLWGVQSATARAARKMWWVDPDFSDWPLGEPQLLQALTSWLRLPQRRLMLLAADFEEVPRRHPRFDRWRVDWSHAIEAWTPPGEMAVALPHLLLDDGPMCVQVFDTHHWRGRASMDLRIASLLRQEVDAVLQRSEPAFPVRQLGL